MASISRNIAELVIRLKDELSGNSENARKRIKSLEQAINQAAKAAALFTAAASAIGAALFAVAKSAANYGDQIAKAATRTGTTTEFISGMRHAAELADVSFEELQNGIFRLSRVLVDAGQGLKEAQRTLDSLGITAKKSNGELKNSEELFFDAADALARLGPGFQQTALAQELFGRSGARMIPLLNQGAAGLKAAWEEARRLGIVIDSETAAAAERFNDDLNRLGKSVSGLKLAIGRELIPAFNEITLALTRLTQSQGFKDFVAFLAQRIRFFAGEDIARAQQQIANLRAELEALSRPIPVPGGGTLELAKPGRAQEIREEIAALELFIQARQEQVELEKRLSRAVKERQTSTQTGTGAAGTDPAKAAKDLAERTKQAVGDTRDFIEAEDLAYGQALEKNRVDRLNAIIAHNEKIKQLEMEKYDIFDQLDQEFMEERRKARERELEELAEQRRKIKAAEEKRLQDLEAIIRSGASAISRSFDGVIRGTQSVGDAFRNMAQNILLSLSDVLLQLLVIEPLIKAVRDSASGLGSGGGGGTSSGSGTNILGSLFSIGASFLGSYFGGAQEGGIVTRPSFGFVGEAGPEAIIPLDKINSIGRPVVNQFYDFRGAQRGVSQEVRREIRFAMKQARLDAVADVVERRKRSRSFADVFQGR